MASESREEIHITKLKRCFHVDMEGQRITTRIMDGSEDTPLSAVRPS